MWQLITFFFLTTKMISTPLPSHFSDGKLEFVSCSDTNVGFKSRGFLWSQRNTMKWVFFGGKSNDPPWNCKFSFFWKGFSRGVGQRAREQYPARDPEGRFPRLWKLGRNCCISEPSGKKKRNFCFLLQYLEATRMKVISTLLQKPVRESLWRGGKSFSKVVFIQSSSFGLMAVYPKPIIIRKRFVLF